MIINDEFKFCFVHIPKCGGTSIRTRLLEYDSTGGAFTGRIETLDSFGMVHYVHLPLSILEQYFPTEYQKVVDYNSFALIRNPVDRFASAVSQRIKEFSKIDMSDFTKDQLIQYIQECIKYLNDNRGVKLLPVDYCHFMPQTSFVFHNDVKVIKHLYLLHDAEKLLHDIGSLIGKENVFKNQQLERRNVALTYRSNIVAKIHRSYVAMVPLKIKALVPELIKGAVRSRIKVERDDKYFKLFRSDLIMKFVNDYYCDDLLLYNSLSNRD